jgi:Terminase RNaseH-like domain
VSRAVVLLDMDDCPHLSTQQKNTILGGVPPWQRATRKSGIPGMGAGAIFPIPESAMLVEPFELPAHWPRSFGLDPGWNCTAAIWFAWDIDNGGAVAYAEYYRGMADPAVHVAAINKISGAGDIDKGKWLPGVIDPAAQAARGLAGEVLLDVYRGLGLNVHKADNTIIPGLVQTWDMLSTQQLRVFNTLRNWRNEIRLYRRDEKGNIVKKNDHLMDAMRYNVMSGRAVAKVPPDDMPNGLPWFQWSPPTVWSG